MLPLIPLEENSVLDQIGGPAAVNLVVDDFYLRVFEDPVLLPFFVGVDAELLADKMKAFLKMALGGPEKYTGKNIRQSHAHLIRMGLADVHFDRVAKYMDQSLKKHAVGLELRRNIARILENYRTAVLNR